MPKNQSEFILQKQVCRWICYQYPQVLFLSDTIASLKLTIFQADRNSEIQKKGFKTPDLLIFEPNNNFHGLFIELKIKSPYKKDGTLLKNVHLEGQEKSIKYLTNKGYYACFSWNFEMTIDIINNYLNNKIK